MADNMADNEVYMLCGHCHRQVIALVRATYLRKDKEHTPVGEIEFWFEWRILQCGSCMRPILDEIDSENIGPPPTVLYPAETLETTKLPQSIAQAYGEVLNVKSASAPACAVMIGQTLEAVCNHEQVSGKDLATGLKKLAAAGRIPPTLAEMANQLRHIRNFGAHADTSYQVTERDIPVLLDFLDAILE